MMWVQASRKQHLVKGDPGDHVIAWSIDVKALGEFTDDNASEFLIGRALADELRLQEIDESGEDVWAVADADSSGLESAWASLLDQHGQLRVAEFQQPFDSVVYLYRFALHPDYSACRLAVLDAVCRTFGSSAVVLAQYHTTWFADTEFELLGFHLLPASCMPPPPGFANIDRETRFMARRNARPGRFSLADYPDETRPASSKHAQWVEAQGPWSYLR